MGKQKELFTQIINLFILQGCCLNELKKKKYKNTIHLLFKTSLNKTDLIRKILNGVTLSNDEIVELLKIIYFRNRRE